MSVIVKAIIITGRPRIEGDPPEYFPAEHVYYFRGRDWTMNRDEAILYGDEGAARSALNSSSPIYRRMLSAASIVSV